MGGCSSAPPLPANRSSKNGHNGHNVVINILHPAAILVFTTCLKQGKNMALYSYSELCRMKALCYSLFLVVQLNKRAITTGD
jgi:hypothetical protein